MIRFNTALIIAAFLLSACASTLTALDDVRVGQGEEQAKASVYDQPTWTFEDKRTKYLVYGYIVTFLDMYDNTVTYYFVKLEDGKVVDKGLVGKKERKEIQRLAPEFDTDQLIRRANP